MYNNKVQMEISGEACLFYFWFSFILGMNYMCELSIQIY